MAEATGRFPIQRHQSSDDYVDWAAITECFKQAFYHEDPAGPDLPWLPNGTVQDLTSRFFP